MNAAAGALADVTHTTNPAAGPVKRDWVDKAMAIGTIGALPVGVAGALTPIIAQTMAGKQQKEEHAHQDKMQRSQVQATPNGVV